MFGVPIIWGEPVTATAFVPSTRGPHRAHLRPSPTVRWRPDGCGEWPVSDTQRHRAPIATRCPSEVRVKEIAARARRRRIVLGAAVVTILVALALPWGGFGGHTLAPSGPVLAGATVSHDGIYVVQPGDTMWSIAQRLDPGADPRVVVADLEAQVGSDTLVAGQRLRLP
ncbi:MAG TPA: LysM peptidoglycan-binding domain-containing protein [Acidimicrobiales bacterium]|nr:LysM peptidoglycan-binding domain-containing protein [Acidimicrobiales bacterium]